MADHPQRRPRPLSPFVTIYHWPVTMATSITHRITGIGLGAGLLILTWWLVAVANGAVGEFLSLAVTPLGQVILFLIAWSLAFHLLNGIRHLAWDIGFGFGKDAARINSWLVILGSVAVAVVVFALAYGGHGGFFAGTYA